MKLIRIFSVVVALHVVGGLLFFQPGCKSRPRPDTAETLPAIGEPTANLDPATAAPSAEETSRPRSSPTRPRTVSRDVDFSSGTQDLLAPLTPPSVPSYETPAPVETTTYKVRSGDSLWAIANRNGVSLRALLDANGLSESSVIQPGQELTIPAGGGSSASTRASSPAPASVPAGAATYTVRSGDSLSVIAQRHGTSVADLKTLNKLSSDVIRIDQVLLVPSGGSTAASSPASRASAGSTRVTGDGTRHVVKSGETPGAIAKRYGVSVDELMAANNISDPRRMQIGQELLIPGTSSATAGSRSAASSAPAETKPAPKPEPKPEPESEPVPPAPAEEQDVYLLPADGEGDFPIIPIEPEN